MKTPSIDTSGTEAAQKAVAAAQESANNLKKNFQADLGTENLTNVVAGGSAADSAMDVGSVRKRKPASGGLSSSLGIY